jgi:hypothetical protein
MQVNIGGYKFGEEHATTFDDVILIGAVVNLLAIPAAGNQVGLLEKIEMMGDGRLGDVKEFDQVADTFFALALQYLQNSLSGLVAQGFAKGDHIKICRRVN